MARAADVEVLRSSTTSTASDMVDNFNVSTIKLFLTLLYQVPLPCGKNIPDAELRVALMKSGYQVRGYTPTIQDVKLEKRFITELIKYERRVQRVFLSNRLGLLLKRKKVLCYFLVV